MKPIFENVALIAALFSAAFWFISATCRLTPIKPGLEDLDNVTKLSGDLKIMSRWNALAASTTGVAALSQALTRLF